MSKEPSGSAQKHLNSLWRRGCDFLGTEVALLGGAMTWVSERKLVSAISNAGGFGVLASGAMPPEILAKEIEATRALTKKPFGVNLITLHPQLEEMAKVCLDQNVSHVVLAGGLPPTPIIQKLKQGGAKVVCFAPSLGVAKRLVRLGADALVIEGQEAGGHIGPVSTSVLAQEILPNISAVPVFVAGGIARGEAVVSYLEMGASGCQLGTRFVCADECTAHPNFKKAFIRANARDAQISAQLDVRFPVIPVRCLVNDGAKKFLEVQRETLDSFDKGELSQPEAQLKIEHFWAGALRRAVVDGDVETGSLMAGQSVGLVKKEQPTQEIIQELLDQAIQVFEARRNIDQDEGERQKA